MKSTIALLLVCFVVAAVHCTEMSSEELLDRVRAKYMSYLHDKNFANFTSYLEQSCPGSSTKLESALKEIKLCVYEAEEEDETACQFVKNHFEKCIRPITQLLEDCLSEKSKQLPRLVVQSAISLYKYLCKSDGEHIFELVNPCIYETTYKSARCERIIRTKMLMYKKESPSKEDVCELAISMKSCFTSHLKMACGNQITREAFQNLYKAFTAPCGISYTTDTVNDKTPSVLELEAH